MDSYPTTRCSQIACRPLRSPGYPDRHIHFRNAGVSGDKARDVLARFDEDIAKFKPKYATILIGMNDGEYTPFEDRIFNTHKKDMTELPSTDHIQSFIFIQKLKGENFDKHLIDRIESDLSRITKKIYDYQFK